MDAAYGIAIGLVLFALILWLVIWDLSNCPATNPC